jgi:succinate dehydrogenase / fumarate reductase cytochrome b subunit
MTEGDDQMIKNTNNPSSSNWWKWFDPRGRDAGNWAFILNRVTALGLALYLAMHLVALGQLALGPGAYDTFVQIVKNPVFVAFELLVVAAGIYHGLNGIRIGIVTFFGATATAQKQIFYVMLVLAIIGSLFFGIRMFTA